MAKLILLVRRKSGLTHEQFRARYEASHVPLASSTLKHLVRYARNYWSPLPGQAEPPYDCVTEFWLDGQEVLDASVEWREARQVKC